MSVSLQTLFKAKGIAVVTFSEFQENTQHLLASSQAINKSSHSSMTNPP